MLNNIILGDCLEKLKGIPDKSVDLIVTSPPYADQRKKTYGGILAEDYVDWFLPRSLEFKRVLKNSGSFVLNIKEKVIDGERSTYVLELILSLKKQGWLWTEEYIWHKKNSSPGKWPNRFRDAWERCLHFTLEKKFNMYQEAVMIPAGEWKKVRLKNLSEKDKTRSISNTQSGLGRNISNWVGRELVYPSNVLHLATECGNKNHSAAFPEAIPEFFIKLFTKEGDLVLDPFAGSGTSLVVAKKLKRGFIGVEIKEEYVKTAEERIALF